MSEAAELRHSHYARDLRDSHLDHSWDSHNSDFWGHLGHSRAPRVPPLREKGMREGEQRGAGSWRKNKRKRKRTRRKRRERRE